MEPARRPYVPKATHPYADAARLPEDPELDADALFGAAGRPLEIEIGPGRGQFIEERAAADPSLALIGVEVRLKWAKIVDLRLRARGLGERARVFAGDARDVLHRLRPDGRVRAFFLHFPDPWWKKRHAKRLVFGEGLLEDMVRLLEPGGAIFVQTDVEDRVPLFEAAMLASDALVPAGDEPGSARLAENPFGARSPREKRAVADGLPVHRLLFRRRKG